MVIMKTQKHHKKLMQDSSAAPRVSLNQATNEKINNSSTQPKPPEPIEDKLADPSIINLIKMTCVKLACKVVLKINDVIRKLDARPLIEINSSPVMKGKWLFDTGAGLTCMSLQQFRLIPIEKRPNKLKLHHKEAKGASGTALIQDGEYLFPMEWNGKTVMQPITVFKNLSSPLIFGIDAIDNLGITYLSRTKQFKFQEELNPEKFQKADLRIIATLKIPAHTGIPVRLGTTIGARQSPMPSGVKAVSTIASLDFPCLCAKPGLVSPDHQGQGMKISQFLDVQTLGTLKM